MSDHTKEPWHVGSLNDALYITAGQPPATTNDCPNHNAERETIARLFGTYPEADANARRIVACVNACAGIPNEVLELDQPRFVAILKQRYELARLLHAFLAIDDWQDDSIAPAGIVQEAQDLLAAIDGVTGPCFDLIRHLHRQRRFSLKTFGPGTRSKGVIDHIRKELVEIEAAPLELEEWVDVILLALDGAWRAGYSPEDIAEAIEGKQERNEARAWPDWRTASPDQAIEHVRVEGGAA